MYLKRLEIQGFKSFADKTTLEFKPGIILVVGPNGSGKSNVADAIRWVLGEQSIKSLRGGKMEDVIFAGSDQRRSLGMAEVSLTIDNSSGFFPLEYNEVTVTRRLYRSGESDFLINRVPCRLRDIHELFMDTGIGREGFSIIGQGKIDEILSVKPEERRTLLEETAGIVKYRYKKREAVKKLNETENSLLRISDIIGELTVQEGPLCEQAEKALLYKNKKTELDGLEIGLIVNEIENYHGKLEKVKNNANKLQLELEEVRAQYYQVQSSEEEYKLELQKKDEELVVYQEKIYQQNLSLEKSESQKKLCRERKADLTVQKGQLEKELEQLQLERAKINSELEEHRSQESELLSWLAEGKEKLRRYEVMLAEEDKGQEKEKDRLEELKNYHFELLREETGAQNEIIVLKQRIETLQKQKEQYASREDQMKVEITQVMEKLAVLEKESVDNSTIIFNFEKELVERDQYYLAEREKLKEQQQQNLRVKEERNNIASRYKLLLEMEKEGQGYGHGVKEILRLKSTQQLAGIIGSVAQIIKVPREYETAVEVVLGGSLQHVVTEDEKAAREAIAWLKNNKRGRVTFLPLDTVKGNQRKNDDVPAGKGVIGRLSELVQYEEKYKGIFAYLLGRTWLVENLSVAVQKGKETGFRYRLVTLDGETVNPGGSLTGGSTKAFNSGILSRKRNIDELQKKVKELDAAVFQGEKRESELEMAVQEAHSKWEEVKEKIQGLRLREVEVSSVLERWRADKGRQELEIESLQLEINEAGSEKEDLANNVEKYYREKQELEKKVAVCLAEIAELQEVMKQRQQEKLKKNEALTQLRIETATVEAKLVAYRKEENYFLSRLTQLKEQEQEKLIEEQNIELKKAELENSSLEIEENININVKLVEELGKQLQEMRQVKHNVQDLINEISQKVKKYTHLLGEKEARLHQLELQQSKWESSLEAAERRLEEQYSLTLAEAKNRGVVLEERQSTIERITLLKEEISELGEVNLGAIEEYSRLKERLDFLHNQVNDMLEAKKRLEIVIQEMDQIMASRFKETYVKVNQAFKEVFAKLFGGGRAELVLDEPNNPLETGVEIIAQPPGKKTQNLSLLSGGERALTAIALLMAMLKVRPSPFCVLDEIESALDEANVNRFADLLRLFAQETQFIVISHRKGTMEAAHVLYGITMEGTGVSRLVSVKLEDAQKEAS